MEIAPNVSPQFQKQEQYKCSECGEDFDFRAQRSRHIKKYHNCIEKSRENIPLESQYIENMNRKMLP